MRFLIVLRLLGVFILTFGLSLTSPGALPFTGALEALAREEEEEEEEEEQDDDDEEENEEDREDDEEESYSNNTPEPVIGAPIEEEEVKPKMVVQNIVTATPVTETYLETDPGYGTDGDNDGLVDALDPDPVIPQTAYFTDDDGDSVPNAIDTWPGADDLLVLSDEEDTNGNGILDSYESL